MDDSILITIKKMLGLDAAYTPFDVDVKVFLNSAMMTLQQIGVGPKEGLIIHDYDQTWHDLIPDGKMMEAVKTYIYIVVKMAFDPPTNSFLMDALKEQKEELEWRLREQAEFYPGDGSTPGYYQKEDSDVEDMTTITFPGEVQVMGGRPGEGSVFILGRDDNAV